MLSIFDFDEFIPLKVLETLWDVEEDDAEEYMEGMFMISTNHVAKVYRQFKVTYCEATLSSSYVIYPTLDIIN